MNKTRLVVAFFQSSLSKTSKCAERVLSERGISAAVVNFDEPAKLSSLIAELPSMQSPPAALLFALPPHNSWTGFLSRLDDGWSTMVNAICSKSPEMKAILVGLDFDAEAKYPRSSFEVFDGGQSVRCVRAWREDNGWHFIIRGEPLPFELTSYYERRKISDRLNSKIIHQLLLKLGINIDSLFNEFMAKAKLIKT